MVTTKATDRPNTRLYPSAAAGRTSYFESCEQPSRLSRTALGKQTGMESYHDPKVHGVAAPKLDLDEPLALTRRCKYAIRNV